MKTVIVAFLVMLILSSASFAQYPPQAPPPPPPTQAQIPPTQTPIPPIATTPPAPGPMAMSAGQEGGMSGMNMDMMSMMSMMHPAIAVDNNAVYVVRGNQVFKLSKTNLAVLAVATLPMPKNTMKMDGMKEMPEAGMTGRGPSTMRPEMEQTMEQMHRMQPSQFEQSFLQNMIHHHQGAIDMSQLALTKATHPELRRFAQKTITDQGREQQQFASWLKTWYQASVVKEETPMDAQMTSELRNLSGRDFEIRFMQNMITHHSEAVQMASDAEQKALHPEVKDAAAKIVTEQSQEIIQLQNWLSDWYGVR